MKMQRLDLIGSKYYVPLTKAEHFSTVTFYLAATLSVVVLFVPSSSVWWAHDGFQAAFVLSVIAHSMSGIVIRTHFAARAHAGRVSDFLSNAFLVPLTTIPSCGYYNTPGSDPFVRLGASVLENTLFTKSIISRMLSFERFRTAAYLAIWLVAVLNRATDLALVAVVGQVLFGEQMISRWIRMEWLRSRSEGVHENLLSLFLSTSDHRSKEFQARVVQAVIVYETSKSQAAISLSSRCFERLNGELSREWASIRRQLAIAVSADPPH